MTQVTPATEDFHAAAESAVDDMLRREPSVATSLGDHRFDAQLADRTPEAVADECDEIRASQRRLAAIDRTALDAQDQVDAELLDVALQGRLFALLELREHERDPLQANPGAALHSLLARGSAPLDERLFSFAGRLRAVPASLAVARGSAGEMSAIALETAVAQFAGTAAMLGDELDRALAEAPAARGEVEGAREPAGLAIEQHIAWLRERSDGATADPRLGAEHFARKLQLSLDLDPASALADPDALLALAEDNLVDVEKAIAEVASRLGGGPREVLDRIAAHDGVTDATVLAMCEAAFAKSTSFVADNDLVSLIDDPVEIVVMPEIYRGVAVAYCDPPGPLETARLPTWFAVSPTPDSWDEARVASFYREYNASMVHELTVHEAMPGHVLQLAHSRRYVGATRVRAACWNGCFAEGWAVYAEELMVEHGYDGIGGETGNLALRMQQLKMQLRMTINAILDVRVHARGMTEHEAMTLMMQRGHQEESEAHGKWRRALLTSAQLSTYFVGYLGVRDLVRDLRRDHPAAPLRQVHDGVLAHGTTPVRHVRRLVSERGI